MKNFFLTLTLGFATLFSSAQYTIGDKTITYTDPARSNRSIGVQFRFPGTNSAVASGQFPFVVFAHGFQMDQTPYLPYADSLAKRGYIVGLLTTETALFPSHPNFAQDLLFVHNKLIAENSNAASFFYQHVTSKGAIGGHSMGGGSTVLAAQYGNPQTCSFTFSGAVTNPSSTAVAPLMTKPFLSFAGSRDCIAPIASHQQPMYDSSGSPCKFLINITDGLHCQYGNANSACSLGEGLSGCASSPLTRQQQIDKTLYHLIPFLDYYLKGDCSAWTLFETRYTANTVDVKQRNCTNTVPSNAVITGNNFFCNGNSTTLTAVPSGFQYVWNDNSTGGSLNVSAAGNYSLVVGNGTCSLGSVSMSVVENFPPALPSAITASDTVCSNISSINISVTNDAAVTQYNWTLPSGWNQTTGGVSNSIEVTSGNAGGLVSVTAENNCGTTQAVSKTIVVVPSNLGTPGIVSGEDTACAGDVLNFSIADVSGAQSYEWNFPQGWNVIGVNDSTAVQVQINATAGNAEVRAVNECGTGTPSQLSVTVNDVPALAAVIIGPDSICESNGAGTYYALDPLPTGNDTYNWTIPNDWSFVGSSNTAAPIINVNSGGNFSVNTTNECGTGNTVSYSVILVDTPAAQIIQNGNTLEASPAGASFTYAWYVSGQQIIGAYAETYEPLQSGTYTVVITDENGCVGSSSSFNFIISNIQNGERDLFSVSPNPNSTGSLQLNTNIDLTGSGLKVFDLAGKLIVQSEILNPQSEINIALLQKGIYVVALETNSKVWRKKLVVE